MMKTIESIEKEFKHYRILTYIALPFMFVFLMWMLIASGRDLRSAMTKDYTNQIDSLHKVVKRDSTIINRLINQPSN